MTKISFDRALFTILIIMGLIAVGHLASGQTERVETDNKKKEFILQTDETLGGLRWKGLVKDIEESRESRRVWFKNDQLTPQGDSLVSMIQNLRYYGLLPKNYHISELETLLKPSKDLKSIFRLDVLLTDAFFSIAYDLKNGRAESNASSENDSLLVLLLDQAIKSGNVILSLEQQEPNYIDYYALKQALSVLIGRLEENQKAQVLKGIAMDSLPLQKQIVDIEVNLERWRQEKEPFKGTYILVNLPSFMLEVITHDTVLFESRVIVGTPRTPTPVLSSLLECFITYPYWHVPRSIATSELLPKLKTDPSYLARNNFQVLDVKGNLLDARSIDWPDYTKSNFPFVLRQQEGSANALGIIKFVFENPYSVYLHDTNAKNLFKNEFRALSHGCVRVEKAEALAHLLATGKLDTLSPLVEKYLNKKQRNTVELPQAIPIYVRYLTCEYKHGKLYQYKDIYKKDDKILQALDQ